MAGKARRMARVMEGFMNQIHVERGGTVNPREQKALIEGHHVERKEAEQNQTGGNPLLSRNIEGLIHNRAIYSNCEGTASALPHPGGTEAFLLRWTISLNNSPGLRLVERVPLDRLLVEVEAQSRRLVQLRDHLL